MRILIEEDYQQMSKKAALMVASQVTLKPDSVLGLATGSTPLGMYRELVNMYKSKEIDFSEVITFNLDEYYQLSANHQQSYNYYMKKNLFDHINVNPINTHLPDGTALDIEKECLEYEEEIRKRGGIDLQILGIGSNGHIGFNEPDKKLNVTTKLVNLTRETINSNSRFFKNKENVPEKAISVGMATILKARRIILLACGKKKARAIRDTVSGYVNTRIPSSLLQTHKSVTLILDRDAASLL